MNNSTLENTFLKADQALSNRADHSLIAQMVEPNSRVLDVGCGDGALLRLLAASRGVDARGIMTAFPRACRLFKATRTQT
jgi:cyclopropane fatty-acyl-phospholipid synthase-like methyltransferase